MANRSLAGIDEVGGATRSLLASRCARFWWMAQSAAAAGSPATLAARSSRADAGRWGKPVSLSTRLKASARRGHEARARRMRGQTSAAAAAARPAMRNHLGAASQTPNHETVTKRPATTNRAASAGHAASHRRARRARTIRRSSSTRGGPSFNSGLPLIDAPSLSPQTSTVGDFGENHRCDSPQAQPLSQSGMTSLPIIAS
jgi:hypothetical protein